ncbi:deoxyribodipyrimidine photolyase, partial [Rhodopirellula sp.]|nr:deoxyribodipyrimidine photolyase [Rhodopirellula sp.]
MTKINPIRDVPSVRVRAENSAPVNTDGEFVLYWMTAFRRTKFNFALQHAANLAMELGKPLIVFEPLQVGYRWASDRLHRFIIDGMASNQSLLESKQVTYLPYVEPQQGDSKGLLLHLSKHSCSIVTDDYPCFFLPSLIRT